MLRIRSKQLGAFAVSAMLALVVLFAGTSLIKARAQEPVQIEVRLSSKQYDYSPRTIKVRRGQRVKLVLSTEDVDHSFSVKELNIDVPIRARQTKSIVFTPTVTGRFRIFCSVYCGKDHKKMGGELVVTD